MPRIASVTNLLNLPDGEQRSSKLADMITSANADADGIGMEIDAQYGAFQKWKKKQAGTEATNID